MPPSPRTPPPPYPGTARDVNGCQRPLAYDYPRNYESINISILNPRSKRKTDVYKIGFYTLAIIIIFSLAAGFGYIMGATSNQLSCRTPAECHRWQSDKDRLEREREQQERSQRQKARLEAGMHWQTPTVQQCKSYGIREYTAQLMDMPSSENWEESCNMTSIIIHNVTLESPSRCENQGWWNGIHGYWFVDFNEPLCVPVWGSFSDEGCTAQGFGKRHFSSRLWNVHGDWAVMCGSTPADIHGVHFTAPTSCNDKGILGIYGIWDVDDTVCQE